MSTTFEEAVIVEKLIDASAATAGQIKFPATQNASSNANTLDDYEEGSWTPTITFGGGSTWQTFTIRAGRYTKIGNRVIISARVLFSSKGSSTGTALLTNLPFLSDSTSGNTPPAAVFGNNFVSGVTVLMAAVTHNSTLIDLYKFGGGSITALSDADFNNNTDFAVSVTYEAAS